MVWKVMELCCDLMETIYPAINAQVLDPDATECVCVHVWQTERAWQYFWTTAPIALNTHTHTHDRVKSLLPLSGSNGASQHSWNTQSHFQLGNWFSRGSHSICMCTVCEWEWVCVCVRESNHQNHLNNNCLLTCIDDVIFGIISKQTLLVRRNSSSILLLLYISTIKNPSPIILHDLQLITLCKVKSPCPRVLHLPG